MKLKRTIGVGAIVMVALLGAAYHFLFGYVVALQVDDRITILQRKNILHQIGANVVIYTGSEESVIVDTQLQTFTSSTRSSAEALLKTPIARIVVTHWHPDHSGGISSFSDDTEVIAHVNVLQRLSVPQEGIGLTKPGSRHKFAPRTMDGLPNETVESRLEIPLLSSTVGVIHYPQAHTDGDLTVVFRDSKIVAVGDLIWPKSFPFIDVHNGGSAAGLESALQAIIEQSKPNYRFIPGHGLPLTFDEVVEYREMVGQTREWVESRLDEGKSVNQIIALGLPTNWDQWASRLVPAETWIELINASRTIPDEAIKLP